MIYMQVTFHYCSMTTTFLLDTSSFHGCIYNLLFTHNTVERQQAQYEISREQFCLNIVKLYIYYIFIIVFLCRYRTNE